jgi:hypothetical protein
VILDGLELAFFFAAYTCRTTATSSLSEIAFTSLARTSHSLSAAFQIGAYVTVDRVVGVTEISHWIFRQGADI